MKRLAVIACVLLLAGCARGPQGSFEQDASGILVTPATGSAQRVRLALYADHIVRVTAVPGNDLQVRPSLVVTGPAPAPVQFAVERKGADLTLSTARLVAHVSLTNGAVRFTDLQGRALLEEVPSRSFGPGISQRFNPGTDEAFFGTGQHQNAQMNLNGEDVEIAQHNMDIGVPFVVSTRNYGLLWDNYSITRFGNPRPYGLASRDLTIRDADGKPGGFTARYAIDGVVRLERVEPDINYQYIRDRFAWPSELLSPRPPPAGAPPGMLPGQTVTWEGTVESPLGGEHKFQLYGSSYFKVYADDRLLLDRWRQNWAAWYHNFAVPMEAGRPVRLRVEWIAQDGYIALLHNDPLPAADRHSLTFTSEAGAAIDYYFIAGATQDEVIAGYRQLTGKAVLLPRWAYGFWQSRQRYTTQQELLDVVAEYRRRGIPLDNIVLDWFYWPEDAWGSHEFDASRFPDPRGMIERVHAQNARFMISVWPKFYPGTDNYRELDAAGHIYRGNIEAGARDWVGPGYTSSFYDPYSQAARDIYWRQVNEKLGVLGVDAWWMDATEPDLHSNLDIDAIKQRIGPTALGSATDYFNTYALVHSGGVYAGQRAARPERRAFILTRSGFAGIQRHAAAVWSGDIASRWDDLYNQISAGVQTSYSGLPNWTFDIGGFANEARFNTRTPATADLAEWRELNLRWFQFGAFVPIFRSHGEFPLREVYNLAPPGSAVYDSLVWHTRLRYRLMPYIYTLAANTWHRDGSIMRGLAMDFAADRVTHDIRDQYLFGREFLVAPVYRHQARDRPVYLPAGAQWYDFHTGKRHAGGQTLQAPAPLQRMPLFVRAGSIVPLGPEIQYSGEKPLAPLTLLVFTGADGRFDLYEDDGTSYGYEAGEFSTIPLHYDAAAGTLTIGARTGRYPGMPMTRTLHVRWIGDGAEAPAALDAPAQVTVEYDGTAQVVPFEP